MERVLVVGPSWLGDMVLAQSLFKDLRQRYPSVTLDVAAPGWSGPILDRMPEVAQSIEVPIPHGRFGFSTRRTIGRRLRTREYDTAIVLPRSFKSALIPYFAGVPRRIGHLGETRYLLINDVRPRDRGRTVPMVQRFIALGRDRSEPLPSTSPTPKLAVDPTNRREIVASLGLSLESPIVACLPGARYGPSKAWPLESYGELARRLADDGKQVWVLGAEHDRESGERIREFSGHQAINLCGRTRLADVVDLLSLTEQVVTNDSGLMHVASAVGTRVIALYGSTTPRYTPPMTSRRQIFHLGLDCSPCFKRRCPLKHYRCLRDIPVDDVLAATRQVD